jgi:hypothetical protein
MKRTITYNFKRVHSKALESVWLYRFYIPPFDYGTISPGRGMKVGEIWRKGIDASISFE